VDHVHRNQARRDGDRPHRAATRISGSLPGLAGRGDWLQTGVVTPDQGRLVSPGPWDEAVIRTPDRRLRVFVSSTLGELAE